MLWRFAKRSMGDVVLAGREAGGAEPQCALFLHDDGMLFSVRELSADSA